MMEHLEELRTRLIKVVIGFVVGALVCWFLYESILDLLVEPLRRLALADELLADGELIVTGPTEALGVRLKVTAFGGAVLSLPIAMWQLWRFVTPGLYSHEKRSGAAFVIVGVLLFAAGAGVAALVLPTALEILVGFGGPDLLLIPRASEYLSFVMILVIAFGASFEFPLVLLALTFLRILTPASLRRGRRLAWIVMLLASAVITPTQDPITMVLLAVPLAALYEATILAASLIARRRSASAGTRTPVR